MRQLSGSNEGGSREGREKKNAHEGTEKKNAHEGTCLAPSRGMQREIMSEPESENALKKAKEPNQQGTPKANFD